MACFAVLILCTVLIVRLRKSLTIVKEEERRQRLVEQDAFRPRGWLDAMHRHYDGLD
jgi:hypothetical protein